ncbi:MAG: hypothetical protein ACRESZ_20990 [Methylococcales bacterium]
MTPLQLTTEPRNGLPRAEPQKQAGPVIGINLERNRRGTNGCEPVSNKAAHETLQQARGFGMDCRAKTRQPPNRLT